MYAVCAYALSEMMVFGRGPFGLFSGIRQIASKISSGMGELFSCMLCLPMWIGIMLSVINIAFVPTLAFTPAMIVYGIPLSKGAIVFNVISDGLFTSGTCWLLFQIESFVENFANRNGEETDGQ